MKMEIKKIMTLLLILFSASCQTIRPSLVCDVSIKFDRCRCRCMNLNNLTILPMSTCTDEIYPAMPDTDSWNFPLEQCDKLVGVFAGRYAEEIKPKLLNNINYCNSK